MREWFRRLLARLRVSLPAADGTDGTDSPPGAVRYHLQCDRCLTPAQYACEGGARSGTANWWLRRNDPPAGFVHVLDVPGTCPVDCGVQLPPGRYTLGVGRGANAIRHRFRVPDAPV